jgi:hypothetical protein
MTAVGAIGDTGYLLGRAAEVEARIRTLIAHRRQHDPAPDDPFRGLYLTDEVVDAVLNRTPLMPFEPDTEHRTQLENAALDAEASGDSIRLRALARAASLTAHDVELLVITLLPDLDSRFERLYGYLNDDVTRRRATIGLALELAGMSPLDGWARGRLLASAPLIRHSMVLVEDHERPFLTRTLRVPDRLAAYLLGDDTMDPALSDILIEPRGHHNSQSAALADAFTQGERLCYLRETTGSCATALATAALWSAGKTVLACDATRLAACPDIRSTIAVLGREALLRNAGVVVAPVQAFQHNIADVVQALTRLPTFVVLAGTEPWDPTWSESVPLVVDASRLGVAEREQLWVEELGELRNRVEIRDLSSQFMFGPRQVSAARQAAESVAALNGVTLSVKDLHQGARAQNSAGLGRLAHRIEPAVSWSDLVLPDKPLAQLHELTDRARNRARVLSDWRMRRGGGRGCGVTGLFAGDSGTGKTMAAEVIAEDLGLELYTVNLATVVDKYVGETEKNLERIFTEASGVSAVLLFDEADAIFGKRSEVRDAHDRYANIESAYLLQRMETFDGLAILATNFRANLDDAFTRRLDIVIDFPLPDEKARLTLWQKCLSPPAPCDDVDLAYYADEFAISGGNIRSAAITAAYLAAAEDLPITDRHVAAAIRQEYRKLGRLLPTHAAADMAPTRTLAPLAASKPSADG